MQESEAGWDPVTIYREPGWFVRIYVLYLFFVLCLSLARSLKLGWQLWGYAQTAPLRSMRALMKHSAAAAQPTQDFEKLLEEFKYLGQLFRATLGSMKRSIILTGIYAIVIGAIGFANVFTSVSLAKSTATAVISIGVSEVFVLVALGFSVCGFIYGASMILEGAFERRRIHWDHKFAEKRLRSTKK
jgi:uncharacterized membrane protein